MSYLNKKVIIFKTTILRYLKTNSKHFIFSLKKKGCFALSNLIKLKFSL